MAVFDRVRKALGLNDLARARALAPNALASPWIDRPTHLAPVVFNDIFGEFPRYIDRGAAIRVPALARARGLIVSTIARLPLTAMSHGQELDQDKLPAWINDTTGPLSPFHRMLWTVDDLFFYGFSLWTVQRDGGGQVRAAERVPYADWEIKDNRVYVQGLPAMASETILIPGVNEGILTFGAETLAQAARLAESATRAADNPAAQVELHQTNEAPVTDEEIDRIIGRWAMARRGHNGGIAFTSAGLEVREHGASNEHLLIDGRNAVAVDIARHAGIPATMIDATLSGSSLSYSNTPARLVELVTFGLAPLMAAVAARLSQDDMTPPGITIEFDIKEFISGVADLLPTDKTLTDLPAQDTKDIPSDENN